MESARRRHWEKNMNLQKEPNSFWNKTIIAKKTLTSTPDCNISSWVPRDFSWFRNVSFTLEFDAAVPTTPDVTHLKNVNSLGSGTWDLKTINFSPNNKKDQTFEIIQGGSIFNFRPGFSWKRCRCTSLNISPITLQGVHNAITQTNHPRSNSESELWANFIEQVYPSQSGLTFEKIIDSKQIKLILLICVGPWRNLSKNARDRIPLKCGRGRQKPSCWDGKESPPWCSESNISSTDLTLCQLRLVSLRIRRYNIFYSYIYFILSESI
jgi:hypothetical protein